MTLVLWLTLQIRIQVMYAGQVVERGTAREIFYESKHPYTWALLQFRAKGYQKNQKQELYALKGNTSGFDPASHYMTAHLHPDVSTAWESVKRKIRWRPSLSDTHKVSCWLQHPKAPKVKSFYDREAK